MVLPTHRMGWGPSLPFAGYGKIFQKHRRLYQQYFSSQRVVRYQYVQTREAWRLALNLLENGPDKTNSILNR